MSRARMLVWALAAAFVIVISRQIAYALAGDAVAQRLAGPAAAPTRSGSPPSP